MVLLRSLSQRRSTKSQCSVHSIQFRGDRGTIPARSDFVKFGIGSQDFPGELWGGSYVGFTSVNRNTRSDLGHACTPRNEQSIRTARLFELETCFMVNWRLNEFSPTTARNMEPGGVRRKRGGVQARRIEQAEATFNSKAKRRFDVWQIAGQDKISS